MKKQYILSSLILLVSLSASWPISALFSNSQDKIGSKQWIQQEEKMIQSKTKNIDHRVLHLSLTAYLNAKKSGIANKPIITVIDYSKPSTEKRLWVFNLKNGKTLFNTWVSHGKNSGNVKSTSFSNKNGSLKSSIGVFVTDRSPYIGGRGLALRLKGLERGINDKAYQRAIVFHGARYVSSTMIKQYGRVGRSWGCPAVTTKLAKPLINTIKNKTLVFAYYPDQKWLKHSKFLAG